MVDHRTHKNILLIGLTFLMLAGFWLAPIAGQAQSVVPNQPAIEQAWYARLADWAVSVWHATVNWIIEQGSHIARAFTFWRDSEAPAAENPVIEESADQPQVLGEEAVGESPPSVPATPPAENFPASPAGRQSPITNNQLPISEPGIVPIGPTPSPIDQPASTIPITTPEIITEPTKTEEETKPQPSSSYFIPILARDTVAPTARVTALSATTTSAVFTVAWTGEDTGPASDRQIRNYDIQYQVDSGDWQDWLMNTVLLSSSFTGLDEKTYGWRARARDNAGNVEDAHTVADTRTYMNLSIPNSPTVTSHGSGATLLSTTADEDLTSGSTVQVTLSGSGDIGDVLTIALAETSVTATTTITNTSPRWSKQFTLNEGANNFTLRTQEADGDQSNTLLFLLNLEMVPTREVVVNEIAWMGSATDAGDEWIELYNTTNSVVDLTNWTITAVDGSPSFTISSGTIAAKSYFLLERFDDTTVFDVTADFVYPGAATQNQMNNTRELLTLRNASSKLIDKAGSSTVDWFAGNNTAKTTMERKDPTGDGTSASNWATNDGVFINGKASDNLTNIKGTPKSLNSQNITIPRPITNLQQQYIYTTTSSVRMYWTAPNNANAASSTPATYDLRYSTAGGCPITESNWSSATAASGEPTPSATAGTVATSTVSSLATNTSYCFAVKTNNGNEASSLSNVVTVTTEDGIVFNLFGFRTPLTVAEGPYLIKASFTINNGQTMVAEPGAVIKMDGNYTITVNGTLTLGSSSDNVNGVVITSKDDNTYGVPITGNDGVPGAGDWSLIAADAATSVLTFNNAIVRYGGNGAQMVRAQTGAQVSITRSIIEYSNSHGVIIGGAATDLALTNSIVRNNLDVGVGITSSAQANITGSTFTGNHRGISVPAAADEAGIVITGNNFYVNNSVAPGNPFAGIHYSDTGILTAENNWWGSASGPTTIDNDGDATRDAAIADGVGGAIDYTLYAASAFTILPSGL